MLKLKYLFDQRELAKMLIDNWKYDEESLSLFDYFRISSNAIYPFKVDGKMAFLRFVPSSEKSISEIEEELTLMVLLRNNAFAVPRIIPSMDGRLIETKETPWGSYHAVVFEGVGQKSLENVPLNDERMFSYGLLLGEFHELSKNRIANQISRKSVFDILADLAETATHTNEQACLSKEIQRLRTELEALKAQGYAMGVIHYDFELDNIMVDENTGKLFAIDFDDAMNGFYGQDIERVLNSIISECDDDKVDSFTQAFLKGYTSVCGNGSEALLEHRNLYKAFADLYKYMRIRKSLTERWDHEPDWMQHLRKRLEGWMKGYLEAICVNA